MAPERTLYALAAFLGGAVLAGLGRPILLIAAIAFLAAWRFIRPLPLALAVGALVFGFAYYHAYFTVRAYRSALPKPGEVFAAIVTDEPQPGPRSTRLAARLVPPHRGGLSIVTSPEPHYEYGDLLHLQGGIEVPDNERDLPAAIFPKIERAGRGEGDPVRSALLTLKEHLLRPYSRQLPQEEAALLGGITLGVREALSEGTREAMKKSGTTHLVALSGYNVQLVIVAVFGAAVFVFGRKSAYAAAMIAITAFVLMVGFDASIMRAAVMACLFLTAVELGRPKSMPHAMLWAASCMTLIDPGVLFDAGFQLSFTSLLGVLYIAPPIARCLGRMPFKEPASLTLGAQAAVAPVLLTRFGEVSLVSLPANLLVLPFIAPTMGLGFALAFAGALFPPLGYAPGLVLHILLRYELAMITWWGSIGA